MKFNECAAGKRVVHTGNGRAGEIAVVDLDSCQVDIKFDDGGIDRNARLVEYREETAPKARN